MKKTLTGSKREQVLIRKAYMLENLKHLSNKNLCDALLYMNTWNCQVGIYYQVTWFKYHELTYILSVWEDTINCHCLRTKTYWLWLFGQKWLSNCFNPYHPKLPLTQPETFPHFTRNISPFHPKPFTHTFFPHVSGDMGKCFGWYGVMFRVMLRKVESSWQCKIWPLTFGDSMG